MKKTEMRGKPDSVCNHHSSRPVIADKLEHPTRDLRKWPFLDPLLDQFRLFGLAPRRVYLVSLQHYLYILSVALVLTLRWTGVTRYVAMWCPDFPPVINKFNPIYGQRWFPLLGKGFISFLAKRVKCVQVLHVGRRYESRARRVVEDKEWWG